MTTVKADIAAADRVLTAAVRKACAEIVDAPVQPADAWDWVQNRSRRCYDRPAIVDMLTAATIAADVLLEERP